MEPHLGLNQLDYIVIGVILVSGLLALMRGLVREMFSLAAWTGAYFVTVNYYTLAEPFAHRYIANPTVAMYSAMLFTFCLSFIILSVIGSLLSNLIRGRALTSIDRSLGFIFGLLRGALVVCLVYMGAVAILWPDTDRTEEQTIVAQSEVPPVVREKQRIVAPDWLLKARTKPYMTAGANQLKAFIPDHAFDKNSLHFIEEKAKAEHMINKEMLENLATPVNAPSTPAAKGDKP